MERDDQWDSVVGMDSTCGKLVWRNSLVSYSLRIRSFTITKKDQSLSQHCSEGAVMSDFRFKRRPRKASSALNTAKYRQINQRGSAARLLS